ncbi:hypothetical protein M8J76_014856 [Diaphorina citri]|nr:hypothetical protein M8J76_014856 [Diaphorina citri]KAI5738054.1 hypothetical protein M8J77_002445 [Diaphorina citri]
MKLLSIFMVTCTATMALPQPPTPSEELKMEARVDDELDDYGTPGFFSFHNGEAFTVEKDPVTGNLDFNKKETPDYGFYKEEIDRKDSKPKIPAYHTPNDIPSNPFKISAVDSSPDLHQFLNLPVHYSTSGKFPLISSSYANMKVQGSATSSSSSTTGSNHRHYTPSTSTTTSQPPSYYTSVTMRTTPETPQPARTTTRPTVQPTQPASTTKAPNYRTTTTTTTPPSTTTTTTTTPAPTTRTTTTEKVVTKMTPPPQQVWNISEPVDYIPEEEISYVDYEYDPDMVNHHLSGHHEHNQEPALSSNNKDAVNFNQKIGDIKQEQNAILSSNKQSSTTTTTPVPQTSTKVTTTSKVSIVTSLPISTSTSYPSTTTSTSTTPKPKEPSVDPYSTSMPVSASEEAVRPGVGNTYLFSGQLGENTVHNNVNNFFVPSSNEDSFKPMPTMNESVPYLNRRPESTNSQEIVYQQRPPVPSSRPELASVDHYQNQKPVGSRPMQEPNRQEPPFPFESNQQQQENYFQQKPNKPVQVEQSRPEKPQYEHNRPHPGQQHQQNIKQERPQKHPGSEPTRQEPPFQFESNPNIYQNQNQYKPERPNKYNQGHEQVQHQHFDPNMKHPPQFHKHPPSDVQQPQVQFTAHLSTGPIPSGPVSHVKRPQNPNIHPSDLRPPPPPSYTQDDSEEEINFVKKPLPSKPVKVNTNKSPISTSGGFVNIQPGKIQSMVPIRIPTEVDQNSQSYSLQTSFSIGASGDDNVRHPVAQGSVIDENINTINRTDLVPPPRPQRPQNIIRTPPPPPPQPSGPVQHWESYTPHHYANNKVKTDSEVLKPSLPNILPQFRPNAKVGHVDPNTQYVDRVKTPLEHLQPPPLPRPQYLRIDRNDEDVNEPMMHSAKQSMRVFQKPPTGNKVTTLQMMQQGQGPPGVPLKRIIRTENKPHHKMPKPNMEVKPQGMAEKSDGTKPVHVVYPTTNQRLTPETEDVVVVGSHGPQRPSPPNHLQPLDENPFHLEDPVPFLLSERDRDTPVLKTKPLKPLKNDFPYSLVKESDFLDKEMKETKLRKPIEETKITQEYTAFSPTESTNPKMDPDTELNVIPYLQDYSPYATRKPPHNKPISVTLKNILASTTSKPNLGMIERVEINPPVKHKYTSSSQDITVGAVMDMNLGNHKTGSMVNRYVPHVNATVDNHRNVEKQSTGSVETQDFLAPFQPSLSNPENQGWRVIGNITREYPEEKPVESETTVKPSEFSFEQFKPQLFGGFKPIVSESDEEELELDA